MTRLRPRSGRSRSARRRTPRHRHDRLLPQRRGGQLHAFAAALRHRRGRPGLRSVPRDRDGRLDARERDGRTGPRRISLPAFSWSASPSTPSGYSLTGATPRATRRPGVTFVADSAAPIGGALTVNGTAATGGGSTSTSTAASRSPAPTTPTPAPASARACSRATPPPFTNDGVRHLQRQRDHDRRRTGSESRHRLLRSTCSRAPTRSATRPASAPSCRCTAPRRRSHSPGRPPTSTSGGRAC